MADQAPRRWAGPHSIPLSYCWPFPRRPTAASESACVQCNAADIEIDSGGERYTAVRQAAKTIYKESAGVSPPSDLANVAGPDRPIKQVMNPSDRKVRRVRFLANAITYSP